MSKPPLCRDIQSASELLKCLSNPNRLAIVCLLLEGERSVMELEIALGIHQPTLSQQITVLRNAGIIAARKEGKHMCYTVKDRRTRNIVETLRNIYSDLVPASALLAVSNGKRDRKALVAAVTMGRLVERSMM